MFRFVEIAAAVLIWSAVVMLAMSGGADLVLGNTGGGLVRLAIAGILFALAVSR